MMRNIFCAIAALLLCVTYAHAADDWTQLIGPDDATSAWKKVDKKLVVAGDAGLSSENRRRLVARPGKGVLVNQSRAKNIITKESFGDCELHIEFMIAKGSNSGVKLHSHYEIQIYDSHGKEKVSGSDCGGVYPLWHFVVGVFTYIDHGTPPRVNAARPPGQWQTLDIQFRAPRFDADGKKNENACLVEVKLNGRVIHENVELERPTGNINSGAKETTSAPLLIQMDHGPIALRNVKIRPLGK